MLSALWGVNDPDQVTVEEWNINGKNYTAFVGNFGTRGSDGTEPEIPDGLFHSIETLIKSEQLTHQLAWFRFFFCNISDEQIFEALKDNEVWEAGLSTLKSLPWTKKDGYYSVRIFLLLRENTNPLPSNKKSFGHSIMSFLFRQKQ